MNENIILKKEKFEYRNRVHWINGGHHNLISSISNKFHHICNPLDDLTRYACSLINCVLTHFSLKEAINVDTQRQKGKSKTRR